MFHQFLSLCILLNSTDVNSRQTYLLCAAVCNPPPLLALIPFIARLFLPSSVISLWFFILSRFVIWVSCMFWRPLLCATLHPFSGGRVQATWETTDRQRFHLPPFFRQTASDSCVRHPVCPRAIEPGTKDASSRASLSLPCRCFHYPPLWLVSPSLLVTLLCFWRRSCSVSFSPFVRDTATIHQSLCCFSPLSLSSPIMTFISLLSLLPPLIWVTELVHFMEQRMMGVFWKIM